MDTTSHISLSAIPLSIAVFAHAIVFFHCYSDNVDLSVAQAPPCLIVLLCQTAAVRCARRSRIAPHHLRITLDSSHMIP